MVQPVRGQESLKIGRDGAPDGRFIAPLLAFAANAQGSGRRLNDLGTAHTGRAVEHGADASGTMGDASPIGSREVQDIVASTHDLNGGQ